MRFPTEDRSYIYEEFDGCWVFFEVEASVGAVATFPGETRFKGKVLRDSFERAGPTISAYASQTLECMFYCLLAPQMTTEAEVLLLDAMRSPLDVRKRIWHKCPRRACMFAQQARSITSVEIARALVVGVQPPFETAHILPLKYSPKCSSKIRDGGNIQSVASTWSCGTIG